MIIILLLMADVFENLRKNALRYIKFILLTFYQHQAQHCHRYQKQTEIELEILTAIGILHQVEKRIRSEICLAMYRYANAIYKYIKRLYQRHIIIIFYVLG